MPTNSASISTTLQTGAPVDRTPYDATQTPLAAGMDAEVDRGWHFKVAMRSKFQHTQRMLFSANVQLVCNFAGRRICIYDRHRHRFRLVDSYF